MSKENLISLVSQHYHNSATKQKLATYFDSINHDLIVLKLSALFSKELAKYHWTDENEDIVENIIKKVLDSLPLALAWTERKTTWTKTPDQLDGQDLTEKKLDALQQTTVERIKLYCKESLKLKDEKPYIPGASTHLGQQLNAVLLNCSKRLLTDNEYLKDTVHGVLLGCKATVESYQYEARSNAGYSTTICAVLSESHVIIEINPELAIASIHIFTCGQTVIPRNILQQLAQKLRAAESKIYEAVRGVSSLQAGEPSVRTSFQSSLMKLEVLPHRKFDYQIGFYNKANFQSKVSADDVMLQDLVIDYSHCTSQLKYIADVSTMLKTASQCFGNEVVEHYKQFNPQGVSGIVTNENGHIAIHTWPEHKYAAINVILRNKQVCESAIKNLKEILNNAFGTEPKYDSSVSDVQSPLTLRKAYGN